MEWKKRKGARRWVNPLLAEPESKRTRKSEDGDELEMLDKASNAEMEAELDAVIENGAEVSDELSEWLDRQLGDHAEPPS